VAKWCAVGLGVGIASYAAYAGTAWLKYGRPRRSVRSEGDGLLDCFMPRYDIVERHHINVAAPAPITFAAACEFDILQPPLIRTIFKAREVLLGSTPDEVDRPREFLALTKSLGWGVLNETPDQEVIMGAVTQPWKADVVFRALPPGEFAEFHEPDYVKIAWTLRADPAGDGASVFRTETRAVATNAAAWIKFRRYWALASPGIVLIRYLTLGPIRDEAERRARLMRAGLHDAA
jgi:hypothetical protein